MNIAVESDDHDERAHDPDAKTTSSKSTRTQPMSRSGLAWASRVPTLDGLRAFAVAFVVWGHLGRTPGLGGWHAAVDDYIPGATFGVRVFFVISGFIITLLLLREWQTQSRIHLGAFYLRRCFRLLPAMGAYLLFVAWADVMTAVEEPTLSWLTSLTFTKNFYAGSWISGHLWTLSVEEQFYLFWPSLLAICPPRLRPAAALVMLPLALSARAFLLATGHDGFAHASLFTNVDFMMAGALVALVVFRRDLSAVPSGVFHTLFGMALAALALLHAENEEHAPLAIATAVPTLIAVCIGVGLLAAVHLKGGPLFRLLNAGPVVYLGRISYSLYLWQQAFFVTQGYYGFDLPLALHFPGTLIMALIAGVLSYEWIEKPAQKHRDAILARLRLPLARPPHGRSSHTPRPAAE